MTRTTKSYRLPQITLDQLEELAAITGLNHTEIIRGAVDRMHQQERTQMMDKVTNAVSQAEVFPSEPQHVDDTVFVVYDEGIGFSVTDNGEEVAGLTKEQAVRIATENITR